MGNTRLNFWKITVIILVVLNISMMVTFSYKPEWSNRRNGQERPDAFIIKTLGFTDAQTAAYVQLRDHHHDSMLVLNAAGRSLRRSLFDNLRRPDNVRITDSIAGLIAANQKAIEEVTYYHFVQVRALCTNEQKVKFDSIIEDVLKKMAGPMHGGPEGHGRGGDGPPPPPDGEGPPDR